MHLEQQHQDLHMPIEKGVIERSHARSPVRANSAWHDMHAANGNHPAAGASSAQPSNSSNGNGKNHHGVNDSTNAWHGNRHSGKTHDKVPGSSQLGSEFSGSAVHDSRHGGATQGVSHLTPSSEQPTATHRGQQPVAMGNTLHSSLSTDRERRAPARSLPRSVYLHPHHPDHPGQLRRRQASPQPPPSSESKPSGPRNGEVQVRLPQPPMPAIHSATTGSSHGQKLVPSEGQLNMSPSGSLKQVEAHWQSAGSSLQQVAEAHRQQADCSPLRNGRSQHHHHQNGRLSPSAELLVTLAKCDKAEKAKAVAEEVMAGIAARHVNGYVSQTAQAHGHHGIKAAITPQLPDSLAAASVPQQEVHKQKEQGQMQGQGEHRSARQQQAQQQQQQEGTAEQHLRIDSREARTVGTSAVEAAHHSTIGVETAVTRGSSLGAAILGSVGKESHAPGSASALSGSSPAAGVVSRKAPLNVLADEVAMVPEEHSKHCRGACCSKDSLHEADAIAAWLPGPAKPKAVSASHGFPAVAPSDASSTDRLETGSSSSMPHAAGSSSSKGWAANVAQLRTPGSYGPNPGSYPASTGQPQGPRRNIRSSGSFAGSASNSGRQHGSGRGSSHYSGRGMPSRGSSPALPTYGDTVSEASSALPSGATTPTGHRSQEPAPTTDLERFIMQVTPMLSLDASKPLDQALQELSLEDVWRFYMEPSVYGREVLALGGHRGPSTCYFTPYLSAMQLFTPASPRDGGSSRMYVSDTEGWPKHMHLKFEHFEQEMPFNRTPIYEHIEQLAAAAAAAAAQKAAAEPVAATGAAGEPTQAATAAATAAAAAATPEAAGGTGAHSLQGAPDAPEQARTAAATDSSPTGLAAVSPATHASPASSRLAASGSPSSSTSSYAEAACEHESPGMSEAAELPPGAMQQQQAHVLAPAGPRPAAEPTQQKQLHGSFLRDARIAELHPASWFAVAWYPVYRIPDAPLCARFLTFHSFAPIVVSMQRAHAALEEGFHRPVAIMPLQVVGLKWYNLHGERWLEALNEPPSPAATSDTSNGSGKGRNGVNGKGPWESAGGFTKKQQPAVMDAAWQAHLGELQATAERLSRGYGLRMLGQMGAEEVRLHHPDYEFFNNRG